MALNISQYLPAALAQVLYIGYFQRSGETEGIEFWADFLQNQDNGATREERLTNATDRFADSDEAETNFPFLVFTNPSSSDINAFVTSVFQNLFNRDPEQGGLEFYRGLVEAEIAKDVPKFSNIILDILGGAQNEDLTTVENKIEASDAYTQELIRGGLRYDGAEAVSLVDSITDQTADPVQAGTDLASDNQPRSDEDGETFTLSDDIDVVTATDANDTIIGDADTTSPSDQVDGGGGTDTIRIFAAGDLPQLISVENVEFQTLTNQGMISTANRSGIDTITVKNSTLTVALDVLADNREQLSFENVDDGGNSIRLSLTEQTPTIKLNEVARADDTAVTFDLTDSSTQVTGLMLNSVSAASNVSFVADSVETVTVESSNENSLTINNDRGNTLETVDLTGIRGGATATVQGTNTDVTITGTTFANNNITAKGSGTDTIVLPEGTGQDIVQFDHNDNVTDTVQNFQAGIPGDLLNVSIESVERLENSNFRSSNLIELDDAESLTKGIVDITDIFGVTDIAGFPSAGILRLGLIDLADTDAVETALEVGGERQLILAKRPSQADNFLVLYDDGTDSFLAVVQIDDVDFPFFPEGELDAQNLVTFTGIDDASELEASNFLLV